MPVSPIGNLFHHSTGQTLAPEKHEQDPNDLAFWVAWVRSIQDYHQGHNGWADIGYNWLVAGDGAYIFEGRGWGIVGAHAGVDTTHKTQLSNSNSHGICFLGDSNQPGAFTEGAKAALRHVHESSVAVYGHPMQVAGHRDRHSTECPGDPLYNWLQLGMPVGPIVLPPPPPVHDPNHDPSTQPPAPADWTLKLVNNLPVIRMGDQGAAVRVLQGLLCSYGYTVAIDGAYGPRTVDALKRYQQAHAVAGGADGIAGRNTWTRLLTVA